LFTFGEKPHLMNVEEFIIKIEDEIPDLVPHKLQPDSIYRDMIDLNYENVQALIAMVDFEFEVTLKTQDFKKSKTIQELFNIIQSKINRS
jgi:acyl carrier protein